MCRVFELAKRYSTSLRSVMQPFPFRGPLTAEWPLPSGTPWREAELYDHDQLRHQHGSTISRHPEPAGVNIMGAQSSSTTTSTCSTNLKTFGIDSFVKLDIWSQVKIDNSFHGVRRQLRQPVLQDVILHGGFQPSSTSCSVSAHEAAADILFEKYNSCF